MARTRTRFIARWVLLLLTAIIALVGASLAAVAFEDQPGSTGLHDEAARFTDEERDAIESAIEEVEAAGAPTVVYLRLLQTEDDQAVEDGQRLMEAWGLESEPGARDGVVFFFNLEPDDPDRGEFGIVAGEAHHDGGALPQSRLNTIRDEMIDLLADDQMADAIVIGLEMTADYLEMGPPEPTAFETFIERIGSGPVSLLNAIALVAAAFLGLIGWRSWRDRPQAGPVYKEKTTTPPSDLHPALAGALVHGSVDQHQVEALMLDLARNGAIALEPDDNDSKKVRVRILNQRRAFTDYELELLTILADEAGEDQVLKQDAIANTQAKWGRVQELIRVDLEESGRFDPEAGRKRAPLWICGAIAIALGLAAAFIPIAVLEEPWSLIGGGALLLVGATLVGMATSYRRTTVEGERDAMPWRGYQDGLREAARQGYGSIDLDDAFPYIVSMGLTSAFNKHLETASEAGYVPAWLKASEQNHIVVNNWFVYWTALHSSMTPSSGGTGSTPGGAATGSGGAGGRF